MKPSSRAAQTLDDALAQALTDLEAGLTPLQVVDRYPDYEVQLGPLLETAYRLRTSRWPTLSLAARVAGREKMHAAIAAERSRRSWLIAPLWRQLGAGVALVLLAGTTYFASPFSPLRGAVHPTVIVSPAPTITATWTVTASPTVRPTSVVAIATPIVGPTLPARRTVEPTEDPDWELAPTATQTPASTLTPRPSVTPTATATSASTRQAVEVRPTQAPSSTATPTGEPIQVREGGDVAPAQAVAATNSAPPAQASPTTVPVSPTPAPPDPALVLPSSTPEAPLSVTATPTLGEPTVTPTVKATDQPHPVRTKFAPPPPLARPTKTLLPPTRAPQPTETPAPTQQSAPTAEPTATPIQVLGRTPEPNKVRQPILDRLKEKLPPIAAPSLGNAKPPDALKPPPKERHTPAPPRKGGNRP